MKKSAGAGNLVNGTDDTALLNKQSFCNQRKIATGIGVPYLNTIASIKAGQDAATTVMPLLSAALYAGQFLSPLVATPIAAKFFPDNLSGIYWIACAFSVLFLLEAFATRRFQSLPPKE